MTMTMHSPLKPLLCRHDFFWSERDLSDRCRRCGKLKADKGAFAAAFKPAEALAPSPRWEPVETDFRPLYRRPEGADPLARQPGPEPPAASNQTVSQCPPAFTPSVKALKAEARERRENLLVLLDRLALTAKPSREDAIDAVLAVIEDAHAAEPVLFGQDAASHFARLHQARRAPVPPDPR